MSEIILLSGSPFEQSGSERVLKYLGELLKQQNYTISYISVRDIPYVDLFTANYDSPKIKEITALIKNAKGIIVGSPVYKASYTGVLKTLIDILPQDILEGKPVLPLMTGGSGSHLLALEYGLKPLLAILKGHNLKGIYLINSEIDKVKDIPILDKDTLERTKKQLNYFTEFIHKQNNSIPTHYTI